MFACLHDIAHVCFIVRKQRVFSREQGFDPLWGFSLEACERESSLLVLKFILFLSAPVRLKNLSAAHVQTIPEESTENASIPPWSMRLIWDV